ncbi:MAG: hypothetical protein QN157_00880 [Armatimonadota bacterium]|nr:hypothetical protein [Armatimonadota bacterium]
MLEVDARELVGMDGEQPCVIDNPTVWAGVPQLLRQAQAGRIRYQDVWGFEAGGANSFIAEFRYELHA